MKRGGMGKIKPKTVGKHTKIWLRECRWCKEKFFTHSFNRYYCCDEHAKQGRLETKRKVYKKYSINYPIKEGLRKKGTGMLGPHRNPNFKREQKIVHRELRRVLSRVNYEGKHKSTFDGAEFSPTHEYVTLDDIHAFSISYLKDNQVKCPECGNKTNLIEHALNICSQCGLILRAPPLHPGYIVDDLLPLRKVAVTVQDLNLTSNLKEAQDLAYAKYYEQVEIIDLEAQNDDLCNYTDSDPLNPVYWRKRGKSSV